MKTHKKTRIVPIISKNDTRFAYKFGRAFERIGFMVLTDHGIAVEKIVRLRRAARELFDLDSDLLRTKYFKAELHGQRGYEPRGETAAGSTVVDYKQFFTIGNPEFNGYENIWPAEVQEFREATMDVFDELMKLGEWLLSKLEQYMKVPTGYLSRMMKGGDTLFRLLNYPEAPEGTVRAGPHGDINLITLLIGAILDGEIESSEPRYTGLDVRGRDGQWYQVQETYNCIVVNVGEMLQHVCELLRCIGMDVPMFKATEHRVIAAHGVTTRRNSYVVFIHAHRDQIIKVLQGRWLLTEEDCLLDRLEELGLMPPRQRTVSDRLRDLALETLPRWPT